MERLLISTVTIIESGFQQKHLCPEFDTLQSNENRSIRFKVQICFSNSSLYTGKLIGRLVFLEKKDTEGREGGGKDPVFNLTSVNDRISK